MTLKSLMQVTALALAAVATVFVPPVLAHGEDRPQHGGIVQEVNEVSFELVAQADGVSLYLRDHGKPIPVKGMTGKLTVLQGARKTEADLQDAGGNQLRATGVKLGKGDKLVAVVRFTAGQVTTVRFTVR